jgi:D-sedoheptulose 7-phosphate isomerase
MFNDFLAQHIELFGRLDVISPDVAKAAELCGNAIATGGKIIFCGNGGSAADSQHIAAELVGRLVDDRPALAALSLTTDTSALTCVGNDYGYDQVFSRQLAAVGRTGDVLVAISTSGNSGNVMKAVEVAQQLGIKTVGLLGRDGGTMASMVDVPVVVPSPFTARIQEAHIFIGHTLCAMIEKQLGYGNWK